MPELENISVQGFKSIASLEELELTPINIVIGPNGSGKSNFIGVFSFLHAIQEGRLQDYVIKSGGAEQILHFGSKVTNTLRIHVTFKGKVNQYTIELEPTEADELVPSMEIVHYWNKSQYSRPYTDGLSRLGKEAGISGVLNSSVARFVGDHLKRWRLYHFHDTSSKSPMKKTANLDDNRFLRPDGSNLASFLYFLRTQHEQSYELIRGTIQRVAPFFDDFQLEPQQLNVGKIKLEWKHKRSDSYFDATSLSDGTLRFMALATLFLQPDEYRPSVILVDEPELGLHPFAITVLGALVRQASATTQVILSTQSPFLLDQFDPEDVLVADLVEGATQFTRLEASGLEEWLETYSLGQLWEKNELGGRPKVG